MKSARLSIDILLITGLAAGACSHDVSAPNPPPPPPPPTELGKANGGWNAGGPDFTAYLGLADTVVIATGAGTVYGLR